MSENHPSAETTSSGTSMPSYDLTGHTICRKCTTRYVRPDDYNNKGQKNVKCEFCRGRVKKSAFPTNLLVPKDVQAKHRKETTAEDQWLSMLTREEESLLVHPDAVILSLSAETIPFDLPRATSDVHWDDVQERLRDIYSLERLFKDGASVQTEYATEANTVAPVGLITVALNNCTVRSGLPFKLCWLHTSLRKGKATVFLAFGAWLPAEVRWWSSATPERRLKACSAWETSIRTTSNAIAISYDELDNCAFGHDGTTHVANDLLSSLIWVRNVLESDGTRTTGELLYPEGHQYAKRLYCRTSAELLIRLCRSFHGHDTQAPWQLHQKKALEKLQKIRNPPARVQEKLLQLIKRKQQDQEQRYH